MTTPNYKIYCPHCRKRLGPPDVATIIASINSSRAACVTGKAAHDRAVTAARARWAKRNATQQEE